MSAHSRKQDFGSPFPVELDHRKTLLSSTSAWHSVYPRYGTKGGRPDGTRPGGGGLQQQALDTRKKKDRSLAKGDIKFAQASRRHSVDKGQSHARRVRISPRYCAIDVGEGGGTERVGWKIEARPAPSSTSHAWNSNLFVLMSVMFCMGGAGTKKKQKKRTRANTKAVIKAVLTNTLPPFSLSPVLSVWNALEWYSSVLLMSNASPPILLMVHFFSSSPLFNIQVGGPKRVGSTRQDKNPRTGLKRATRKQQQSPRSWPPNTSKYSSTWSGFFPLSSLVTTFWSYLVEQERILV